MLMIPANSLTAPKEKEWLGNSDDLPWLGDLLK